MALQSAENQYRGVNAHLHSKFQSPGDSPSMWPSFHGHYIYRLVETLNATLPSHYRAVGEQSLYHQSGTILHKPKPDVTLFQQRRADPLPQVAQAAASQFLTIEETLPPPHRERFIIIYAEDEDYGESEYGRPVARIEVLSPSNKEGSTDLGLYINRREEALVSGIPLVEVDLLHETASPILGLKRYPHEEDATPYTITISDPRLPAEDKPVRVYGFLVDDPIPTLPVPLADQDSVNVDFGTVYQQTFVAGRWGDNVDYGEKPHNFHMYSAVDQQRILARMEAVRLDMEKASE